MTREPWNDASSSMIATYRFDEGRQVLQTRSKRSGKLREYHCTPTLYGAFLEAPSMGRFVLKRLQPMERTPHARPLAH